VINAIQQNDKRTRQLVDYKQTSSIVEFCHLSRLDFEDVRIDYVEQFLLDHLCIRYEHLIIVTQNFTSDAARANCSKVKRLIIREQIVRSKDFYLYFPLL
jgi:hypothetical protein